MLRDSCVLIGLLGPGATFALWSTFGALVAFLAVTTLILARGTYVGLAKRRIEPLRIGGSWRHIDERPDRDIRAAF